MAERLKDKVALVTGAANGTGLVIADLITPRRCQA
jgi:NAD(P)-dependent dehydrogenase (short-subunit alcohol dehydrogenase family)